ncbi:MAG: 50S ribosomal protein L25 [Bacteroidota bacterium]
MKTIDIEGSIREEVGKRSTKKLRQKGHVPCILYRGGRVLHFEAPEKNFFKLVYSPDVYLVNLKLDGEVYNGVMQDIQFHPVKDNIQHIDFFEVVEKYPFWMQIPVRYEGVPAGVTDGGKEIIKMRKVVIRALPKDMPDEIKLDVSKLTIGDSIRIGDISYENLEILDDPNSVMVLIKSPRGGAAFALPEDELAEGEEGEEEGEEGEAAEAEEGEGAGEGSSEGEK